MTFIATQLIKIRSAINPFWLAYFTFVLTLSLAYFAFLLWVTVRIFSAAQYILG